MRKRFRHWSTGALAAGCLLLAAAAPAKVDLVTLPGRDSSQLTIYNSQDLTLTRETRTLSFSEGKNEIQFSWANTLIDPTSLHINVDSNPSLSILDAVYPANTSELIMWNIEAEEDTSAAVEISYFTSGLSWSADYIVKANAGETEFALQQFTTVRNNSGEDFDKANVRVVVGEVNLVELIADLARKGITVEQDELKKEVRRQTKMYARDEAMPMASAPVMMEAAGRAMAAEIIKKAVSEYYIFAVEGEEDIKSGWGKELPNPEVRGIPFDLSYEIDPHKYGNAAVKFYKLKNDTQHELGKEPLPDGQYYVYSARQGDGIELEGRTHHKYAPVGEDIELNLGSDGLVLYEERVMDMERKNFEKNSSGDVIGWDEVKMMELEITNSRDREVPLKLTHHLSGDWEFSKVSNSGYEKVDRDTVRWEIPLPAQDNVTISYTIVIHNGSRAKAN